MRPTKGTSSWCRAGALVVLTGSLAACAAPARIPSEERPANDPRLECARAIARHGAPSPTPHLDSVADIAADLTPQLGLAQLLESGASVDTTPFIRSGDQLLVTIDGHPEFSGPRTVLQGRVDLPPIGPMPAAGRTPTELADRFAQQLAETYLHDRPRVAVSVTQRVPYGVQVIGRVGGVAPGGEQASAADDGNVKPGAVSEGGDDRKWVVQVDLPPDRATGVYELLTRLGGPGPDADADRLALIRRPGTAQESQRGRPPETRAYHFTWAELARAHLQGRDAWLQADDQVIIPRRAEVHVYGAVQRPGRYPLLRDDTVASVVQRAGGLAQTGGADMLLINADGEQAANPDEALKSGQVVWVSDPWVVHVVGAGVLRSGPVAIPTGGLSVIQAISEAGWFTPFASQDSVEILREEKGSANRRSISVPVSKILSGDASERSFLLQPGDTVVVPEGMW